MGKAYAMFEDWCDCFEYKGESPLSSIQGRPRSSIQWVYRQNKVYNFHFVISNKFIVEIIGWINSAKSAFQLNQCFYNSSIRRGKVVRINSNGTYDIVHSANEERLDKFVLEEDLRAPEGAINYGDLITLVKVHIDYDFKSILEIGCKIYNECPGIASESTEPFLGRTTWS